MAPIEDILKTLQSETDFDEDKLKIKIQEKQNMLSGMVSEEGAAYLVAKDLGVNLDKGSSRKLEIKNIIAGMRNVSVAGRIFKKSDIIEFKKKDGSEGRVVNLFVGDRTGFVRVPLWNEQVKLIEDDILKLGDIVQISGAYAQENIYGDVELSLGKYGEIFDVTAEAEGSDIGFPSAEEMSKNFLNSGGNRVHISEVKPGKAEIKGTVIDVIKSGFIFNVCPKCGKKVSEESEKFTCEVHGEIKPEPKMYMSFMVDDGTGILRSVAFRDVAESISGISAEELSKMNLDERHNRVSGNVVGKEYILDGNVKKNTRYDRFEIVLNKAEPINISEESEKLKSLLKMKLS